MPGVKGRSGAKPKPNKTKELTGSKHTNKNPVEFGALENVDPPEWLPELAKQMWKTICPHLCDQKVLSVTDIHNLEVFCNSYATWRAATEELEMGGLVVEGATGGPIKNPAATVVNEALKQMQTYGTNLGLDPSSRGRLTGQTTPGGQPVNPFDEF